MMIQKPQLKPNKKQEGDEQKMITGGGHEEAPV